MNPLSVEEIVTRLDAKRSGSGWTARCPAHNDRGPSLSISEGSDGRVLMHCHAGCSFEAIVAALGVEPGQLFPDTKSPKKARSENPPPAPLTEAQIDAMAKTLRDDPAAWNHATEVLKFSPGVIESCRLGMYVGDNGRRFLAYVNPAAGYANCRSLDGPRSFVRFPAGQKTHLYRHDTLKPGGTAILFEGERDAVAALTLGLELEAGDGVASIVSMPGGEQVRVAVDELRGQSRIYVATDTDQAGEKAAATLIKQLGAHRCRRVRFPGVKDLGDLLSTKGPDEAHRLALEAIQVAEAIEPEPKQPKAPAGAIATGREVPQESQGQGSGAVAGKIQKSTEVENRKSQIREAVRSARLCEALPRRRADVERGLVTTPSALAGLNELVDGGYPCPGLVCIVAPPKCGKSQRAVADVRAHLEADPHNVALVLDLENGPRRFDRRLMCQLAELDPGHLERMTAEEKQRWDRAYTEVEAGFGERLIVLFGPRPATEIAVAVQIAREMLESGGKLMVVVDSLNRLPGDMSDRRALTDEWIEFFERMRDESGATILLILEVARSGTDGSGYRRGMTAGKESGRIEYASDLLLGVDRLNVDGSPVVTDDEPDDGGFLFTVRIEAARDTTTGYIGPAASYRLVRPHYGFQEVPLVRRTKSGQSAKAEQNSGAIRSAVLEAVATGPAQGTLRHWEEALRFRGKGFGRSKIGEVIKELVQEGALVRADGMLEKGPKYGA